MRGLFLFKKALGVLSFLTFFKKQIKVITRLYCRDKDGYRFFSILFYNDNLSFSYWVRILRIVKFPRFKFIHGEKIKISFSHTTSGRLVWIKALLKGIKKLLWGILRAKGLLQYFALVKSMMVLVYLWIFMRNDGGRDLLCDLLRFYRT